MSAPRIQIYEKVLTFTVLFSPCIGYYVYFIQGQDDRRNEVGYSYRNKVVMVFKSAYISGVWQLEDAQCAFIVKVVKDTMLCVTFPCAHSLCVFLFLLLFFRG